MKKIPDCFKTCTTKMSAKNSEGRHVLELDDDCIYRIYNYLPIIDWCSLSDTCTRFKKISDECFKLQSDKFELTGSCIPNSKFRQRNMKEFETVIRHFAPLISQLTIDILSFPSDEALNEILPLIAQHCISLRHLNIFELEIDVTKIKQFKGKFANLERLKFEQCPLTDEILTAIINNSPSLKELEFYRICIKRGRFPQLNSLESLTVVDCTFEEFSFFEKLLVRNPQLKTLKLLGCDASKSSCIKIIMKIISDHLSNLEELRIYHLNSSNLKNLHLPSVKKLEMDGNFTKRIKFFKELATYKQIESLRLSKLKITNELLKTLCNLKTLKVLIFTEIGNLKPMYCYKLASELTALLEIHIYKCSDIRFSAINVLAEFSLTLSKIAFYPTDFVLHVSKEDILTLITARKRNPNKETLTVLLYEPDCIHVSFSSLWSDDLNLQTEAKVLKLLPLPLNVDWYDWYSH